MSIQPYYAYLEMKGIKTVEMRKTEPKDKEWSGKVKVYVSQNKKSFNRIPKEDRKGNKRNGRQRKQAERTANSRE